MDKKGNKALVTPRGHQKYIQDVTFHMKGGQVHSFNWLSLLQQPKLQNTGTFRQILKQFTLRTQQTRKSCYELEHACSHQGQEQSIFV